MWIDWGDWPYRYARMQLLGLNLACDIDLLAAPAEVGPKVALKGFVALIVINARRECYPGPDRAVRLLAATVLDRDGLHAACGAGRWWCTHLRWRHTIVGAAGLHSAAGSLLDLINYLGNAPRGFALVVAAALAEAFARGDPDAVVLDVPGAALGSCSERGVGVLDDWLGGVRRADLDRPGIDRSAHAVLAAAGFHIVCRHVDTYDDAGQFGMDRDTTPGGWAIIVGHAVALARVVVKR